MTALTNEEFLRRCKEIHGNRYKYLDEYTNRNTKIRIACQEHGIFLQAAGKHLQRQNCPKCSMISGKNKSRKTKDQFIKNAIKIHDDKYDYSEIDYINAKTKISIYCNNCELYFEQSPNSHLGKRGCPMCRSLTQKRFLEKVTQIHGEKYEYLIEVDILNSRDKIKIKCKECNITFEQEVNNHLKGYGHSLCGMKKAGINKRKLFEQFLEEAIKIHCNKFEYNKDTYTTSRINMEIKCLTCNNIFNQAPDSHLRGHGCTFCILSKGEQQILKILKDKGISNIPQYELSSLKNRYYDYKFEKDDRKYILEYDGQQHFEEVPYFRKSLEEQHIIDIIKTHAAIKAGYTVLRIDYTIDFEDLEKVINYALKIPEDKNLYVSNPKLYSWLIEGAQYLEDVM